MVFKLAIGFVIIAMSLLFLTIGISEWNNSEGSDRLIPVGIGGFFLFIGIIFKIAVISDHLKQQKLLKTGELVKAKITGVKEEKSRSKGLTYITYKLKLEYNGTAFLSDSIVEEELRQAEKHETINVYIDKNNPKNYYVDVKSIIDKKTLKDPMKNPMWMFVPMLLLIGIVSAGVGIFAMTVMIADKIDFRANGVSVDAEIERIDDSNVYVIFYTEDNREIQTRLNVYDSSMQVGQKVTIMYHRNNPKAVHSKGIVPLLLTAIIPIVGSIMITVGIKIILKQMKIKKMQSDARETGKLIKANIKGIIKVENVRRRGFHPEILEAEYEGRIFHSRYLKFTEISKLKLANGTVNIYLNREDNNFYYIDLESLKR